VTPFERAARTHAESRGSRGTRDLYLADLTRWLLFCQLEGIDPEKPNLAAATKFRDELLNKVSKTTARHTCLAISAMYNNALDDEGRPIVPYYCEHCDCVCGAMADAAGARLFVPVHHQSFRLSREPIKEPIERAERMLAAERGRLALREIGETAVILA
jgi:hypothetical protein